jgi:hypothetical protein
MTAGPATVTVARPSLKKGHVSGDVVRPNLVVGAGGMIMAVFLILPLVALILDAAQSDVFIASLTSPFALMLCG